MNNNTGNKQTTKEYNLTVAPLWMTKQNNLKSIVIGPEQYDALQKIKIGGMILVKFTKEGRGGENTPKAYLEYLTPQKVDEMRAKLKEDTLEEKQDSL